MEGQRCDSCRHGYHTLEQRNSLGCLPCVCDISGTVPEGVCDTRTGQCPCKEGVEGTHCTSCFQNYYNSTLDLASKKTQNWRHDFLQPLSSKIFFRSLHFYCWNILFLDKFLLVAFIFVRRFVSGLCAMHLWPQWNCDGVYLWQHNRTMCLCPVTTWKGL